MRGNVSSGKSGGGGGGMLLWPFVVLVRIWNSAVRTVDE
jgi:hypothetical protein